MRIVSLEEHISFKEITDSIPKNIGADVGMEDSPMMRAIGAKLDDITGERLKSMNDQGISMQVLSVSGLGAEQMEPAEAPALATRYNDLVAQRIKDYPDRFTAFAHLPMTAPAAAADELERMVKTLGFRGALINGMIRDTFLDDPKFAPILKRAEQLGVPIYLHPGLPPKAVQNAYYNDLPKNAGMVLSIAGWGWHSETALHILRLILSGTFDKYPALKLIIGHMGEMLPVMMARCDNIFKANAAGNNQRTVTETLRQQVHITTSGIFTQPPLRAAIDTFGIDNIMFSVDYPFSSNEQGRTFLDSISLPGDQVSKIAHGNADKLLKLNAASRKSANV